jgi:hypothetical protein
MKKISLVLGTFALIGSVSAQSLGGSGSTVFLKNGSGSTSPLNFGIGTDAPTQKLHIVGNEAANGRLFIKLHNTNTDFNSAVGIRMTASNNESKFGNISYNGSTYANGVGFEESFNVASFGNSLNFGSSGTFRFYPNANPSADFLRISELGNIGIGTNSPTQKLQIEGNESTSGRTFLKIHNNNDGAGSASIFTMSSGVDSKIGALSYNASSYSYANNTFAETFNVYCNGKRLNMEMANENGIIGFTLGKDGQNFPVEKMRITKTGLGIGTEAPTAKLHSKGTVRMESLAAGSSFILTADADGNLLKSTTLLTELNTKISDLTTRLTTAEEEIKILKKKVGLAAPATVGLVKLFQNEPNPATTTTKIKFFTPETVNQATIFIFDVNGRMLQQYDLKNVSGNQEFNVDANTLEAGMYFYTLLLNGKEVDTKKMFITK